MIHAVRLQTPSKHEQSHGLVAYCAGSNADKAAESTEGNPRGVKGSCAWG